jgi:hypothetical protein
MLNSCRSRNKGEESAKGQEKQNKACFRERKSVVSINEGREKEIKGLERRTGV